MPCCHISMLLVLLTFYSVIREVFTEVIRVPSLLLHPALGRGILSGARANRTVSGQGRADVRPSPQPWPYVGFGSPRLKVFTRGFWIKCSYAFIHGYLFDESNARMQDCKCLRKSDNIDKSIL